MTRRIMGLLTTTMVVCAPMAFAVPDGLDSFTGAAAGKYRMLFPEAQQAALDEINRAVREVRNVRPPNATDEQLADAAAKREDAWNRLQQVLSEYPDPLTVRIDGASVTPGFTLPLELPGYAGAYLMRIDAGTAGATVATAEYSYTGSREMSGPLAIQYLPGGVTWVLLAFYDVPKGLSAISLALREGDTEAFRIPLALKTPEDAQLGITVRDEQGRPTPAMVRLYWKTGNLHYLPSNAIDLAPQFESQGSTSSLRRTHYGGSVPGEYGCTPGPFDMHVAPGEWEITVRRGIEHEVINDSVTLAPGDSVAKEYILRQWVDMTARGWYSGDDHVHSRIMSDDDAQRTMTWAKAEDVHLVNIVKMGDIYRTFFEQRGFGPDYRVVDGNYILSPGQECPRTHSELGHTISMNIKDMVRDTDKYYLYDWVFDTVQAQGGLSGYAHVNSDLFFVHRDMTMNVPKQTVDFAEILQFNVLGLDVYYEFLNLGFPLTASAGSDVPWGGTMGESRVYAYIGDQPFTADTWFKAVDDGRTFVTNGPMLEFRVEDAFPGDTLHVTENRPLHVVARAWGHAGRTMLSKLEVIQQGDVVRDASSDDGAEELRLEFELGAGHGWWIAARAFSKENTSAHTTPIYVVREPLRFWKHEAASDLIAKRLESLDEIETVVKKARETTATEGEATARPIALLVEQGDALMQRVESARALYRDLVEDIETERTPRAAP